MDSGRTPRGVQGKHREIITLAQATRWYSFAYQQYPWMGIFKWGAAGVAGDRQAQAELLDCVGWTLSWWNPDLDARLTVHRNALAIAVEIGDRREEALAAHRTVLIELDRREDQIAPDLFRYHRSHT